MTGPARRGRLAFGLLSLLVLPGCLSFLNPAPPPPEVAAARHVSRGPKLAEAGDDELAELERRGAEIERAAAALERERAAVFKSRGR